MSQDDLAADVKASLQDAAEVFTAADNGDFKRHLDLAALDLARVRPRTMLGTLTLVADQEGYTAPADFHSFKSALWGASRPQPWEKTWPGRLPSVFPAEVSGVLQLQLVPPPTAAQISVLGSTYKYYYYARHLIDANAANTTVKTADRGLLLLRAQAEAMKEIAVRNSKKPVQLRDGISGQPRNGTPSYLFEALMEQFEKAAA